LIFYTGTVFWQGRGGEEREGKGKEGAGGEKGREKGEGKLKGHTVTSFFPTFSSVCTPLFPSSFLFVHRCRK